MHDVSKHLDSVYLFRDVEDFNGYGRRSWRRHAVITNALMDNANQMRCLRILEFEVEEAGGVSLSAVRFFHPLGQFEQDDFISSGRLASGGILYCAADRLSRSERG
jgi:hypothetical protein